MSDVLDITLQLRRELEETRARLAEAEQTVNAIRNGKVDGLVVNGPEGQQVFTLHGAQEPYRLLIEQMSEGALTLSREGGIFYSNQTFARLLQTPLGQVIGANLRSFLNPADQQILAGLVATAWGANSRGEVSVRAADGSSVPVRLGLSRLQLDAESLLCVVATDLTEEKKREEAMRRLQNELEARVAQRTADLTASRLAAVSLMEEAVESKHALETANLSLNEQVRERERAEEEVRQANAELERRVTERTTQLSEANQILKQRAAELETANHELDSFSYSVSHDLRAPLRHVSGYASLLRQAAGPNLPEESRHFLDEINGSAAHMGRLIDGLLLFSRMGRAGLRPQELDLAALVEATIHQLRPESNGRNIRWQTQALPPVHADPVLLRQVLVNLLSNALKYTRTRDPATIEIGCASNDGPETVIFVRDNGVGFDMEYGHKLFGVFQRLHANEEFEGTGIGLANVRRIISRHGGRTWAEGKVDEGATFYFSLPILGPQAVPARSTLEHSPPPPEPH